MSHRIRSTKYIDDVHSINLDLLEMYDNLLLYSQVDSSKDRFALCSFETDLQNRNLHHKEKLNCCTLRKRKSHGQLPVGSVLARWKP